jgi:hypothetical protein
MTAGLLLPGLGWSRLVRGFELDTVIFVAVTCCAALLIGGMQLGTVEVGPAREVRALVVVFVSIYFLVAYATVGGVPLLLVYGEGEYDVYGFGVPGVHVVMLAYTSYYALRCAQVAFRNDSRRALRMLFVMELLLLSAASRSAISVSLFGCLAVFVRARRLRARAVLLLGVALVLFVSFFGLFGNRRLDHQIVSASGNAAPARAIETLMGATPEFRHSGLPSGVLWPYMYGVSPSANLDKALSRSGSSLCGPDCDLTGLFVYELLPDVIGVRLGDLLRVGERNASEDQVSRSLTASTAFGSAVGYAGILGGVAVVAELVFLGLVVSRRFGGSIEGDIPLTIVNTIVVFAVFENMIAFSPVSLQLIMAGVAARRAWWWS